MYNEDTDANNPMFDLNRQLTTEDKNVVILTKKNLSEIINNIHENKKKKLYNAQPLGLFDEKNRITSAVNRMEITLRFVCTAQLGRYAQ